MQPFNSADTSLEQRVQTLETRLKRQQQLFLLCGLGALLAVGATRAISQNDSKQLTLRTLNIVGSDGKLRAILSGDAALNKDGGSLALVDDKGVVRLGLMASKNGGSISIFDPSARPVAMLGSSDDQGALSLSSSRSKARVNIVVTRDVSGLVVAGGNGREHFVAGSDQKGGMAQIYDFDGKLQKQLP